MFHASGKCERRRMDRRRAWIPSQTTAARNRYQVHKFLRYFEPKFNLNFFAVLEKIRLPFPDPRVLFTETRWFRMNLRPFPRTLRVCLTSNKRIYTIWATPIITNSAEIGIGCVIYYQSFRCNSTGICVFQRWFAQYGIEQQYDQCETGTEWIPKSFTATHLGIEPATALSCITRIFNAFRQWKSTDSNDDFCVTTDRRQTWW